MDSRAEILNSIADAHIEEIAYPGDFIASAAGGSKSARFAEVLAMVGGSSAELGSSDEIPARIAELDFFRSASRICNSTAFGPAGNISLAAVTNQIGLEGVQAAIVEARFGVAENAAVWIPAANFRFRSLLFLAEHLIVLLPKLSLVEDMHEAYSLLAQSPAETGYFISGPTKTADIEQNLVIGAQGPKSLTVFLV